VKNEFGRNTWGRKGVDTDPTDRHAVLSIDDIEEVAGKIRVTLDETSVGRVYRLYQSDDLGISDPWSLVAGPLTGTDGSLTLDDTEAMGMRGFFRVGVELP
jgi:hypothetical protein